MIRVNELLRREIGAALFRVLDEEGFDLSAATVTHVETSSDLRSALVLVSIRGHERERDSMLAKLRRHRAAIQDLIGHHVILKYTPRLSFALDTSLEEGDRVLGMLKKLEEDALHE